MKRRDERRHFTPDCWCGSSHSWEAAKGYCTCNSARCLELHRSHKIIAAEQETS